MVRKRQKLISQLKLEGFFEGDTNPVESIIEDRNRYRDKRICNCPEHHKC